MSELVKLANIAKQYVIGDKVFKIKALSLLQLAQIRQELIDYRTAEIKRDIKEILTNDAEKLKAIREIKVKDDEIEGLMASRVGINLILSKILKLAKDKIEELLDDVDASEILWDIYCHALGIRDEDNKKESANSANEVPDNQKKE